ncbi:MAG: hypothetical protein Q8L86_02855 [Vicinamibacterales bacterium]|nr:hypothetical protein [Vicinamibacterales bacterium]
MQNHPTSTRASGSARVVVVGGGPEVLTFAEPLLPRGAYEADFLEGYDAPYGAIRAERPDLVVLCLRIEDHEGFQLLSMLRLDPATRQIPVLTYTTEFEGQRFEGVDEGDPFEPDVRRPGALVLARH